MKNCNGEENLIDISKEEFIMKLGKKLWMTAGLVMYLLVVILLLDHYYNFIGQDVYYTMVNAMYGCGAVLGWAPAIVLIGKGIKKIKERRSGRYITDLVRYLL